MIWPDRKSTLAIPEPIVQLQRQLDQFRSTQPRRTKLPESLWQAAVELEYKLFAINVRHFTCRSHNRSSQKGRVSLLNGRLRGGPVNTSIYLIRRSPLGLKDSSKSAPPSQTVATTIK